MKNIIKNLLAPIDRSDYIRISILGGTNVLFCVIGHWLVIAVFAIIFSIIGPWISYYDWDIDLNLSLKISYGIVVIAGTVLAGIMIRKFRVWVLSLPLQYILCFMASCIEQVSGDGIDLAFSAMFALAIILVQIPGVAIGLLIRLLIRKLRSRKQPTPA